MSDRAQHPLGPQGGPVAIWKSCAVRDSSSGPQAEITLQARSPREIPARHGENEAGAFRAAGTRARERLSLPRREASNDPFEDGGDQDGDRGPVSGRLHVRRSWGEADGRRGGSAVSLGARTDSRPESSGSRPRWREPWRGCFPAAGSTPRSTSFMRLEHGKRRWRPVQAGRPRAGTIPIPATQARLRRPTLTDRPAESTTGNISSP